MISRRRALQGVGAGVALVAAGSRFKPAGAASLLRARRRPQTVAVFGGGVAGLTAAHELAERGLEVTVYEARAWGGKARSTDVPHSAVAGRNPLPAEHGFRVVFGFYDNLPDTLRRIPFGSNPHGVFDNMVPATDFRFSRAGRADLLLPVGVRSDPRAYTVNELTQLVIGALQTRIAPQAAAYFGQRLAVFLSSCDARRAGEWENVAWTDFIATDRYGGDYREIFADFPNFVQASHGDRTSTTWMAGVFEVLVYTLLGQGSNGPLVRPLDAPTNEAWIDPWLTELRRLGVRLELGQAVAGLEMAKDSVVGARMAGPTGVHTVRADWYVCALPVERARALLTAPVLDADPKLAGMRKLETGWMTGIMFYLRRRTSLTHGHVIYFDSPWAITSISQAQFWKRDFAGTYGDGRAHDCLSAIIAEWGRPGIVYGKPARDLRPDQVAREAWEQMKVHLNDTGSIELRDEDLLSWYLDPGMRYANGHMQNADPLTIPTVGTWSSRPAAGTKVANLVLAGDYLNGLHLVGTMESANKAGRIAANVVLERSGSTETPVPVLEHYRPPEWEPLKRIDEVRFRQGKANLFDVSPPWGAVGP